MKQYLDVNRALWDRWTKIHAASAFYDVEGFSAGRTTLMPLEREELGDVTDQTLLHLQCHFGLDTLSWAREGARVTGVDFSPEAIILARSLSDRLNIPATFLCSDIFDLRTVLDERFDIVFTSYGVLPWLPDLTQWAHLIAHYLQPGGTFYIVEFHPFLAMLDDAGEKLKHTYFHTPEPRRYEEEGSYADPEADILHPSYEWVHGLGDVVTALLTAGLTLEYVHEFPYSTYRWPPYLEEEQPGRYTWKNHPYAFPLMFSIKATRKSNDQE